MLGYVSAGILDVLSTAEPTFMDRSPMNVLEWHFLWKFMHKFYTEYGNVLPDPIHNEGHGLFFMEFDQIFEDLKVYCKMYTRLLDIVCIIDSNIGRCDNDRLLRNQGTDLERSSWRFYTFMQNRMYKRLHKCIDLAWFDDVDELDCDTTIATIASCLKHVLMRFPRIPQRHYGRPDYCLPIPIQQDNDLTLRNYNTFVYREVIRQKARHTVKQDHCDIDGAASPFAVDFEELPQVGDILGLPDGELRLKPFVIESKNELSVSETRDDYEMYMNESNMEEMFF